MCNESTCYEHHSFYSFFHLCTVSYLNKESRESRDCYPLAVIMWPTLTLSPHSVIHLEIQSHKVWPRIVEIFLPSPIGHSHDFRSSVVNNTHVERVATVTLGAYKEHVLSVPGGGEYPWAGVVSTPFVVYHHGKHQSMATRCSSRCMCPSGKGYFLGNT